MKGKSNNNIMQNIAISKRVIQSRGDGLYGISNMCDSGFYGVCHVAAGCWWNALGIYTVSIFLTLNL